MNHVQDLLLLAHARGNPPDIAPPEWLGELWTRPAPLRPFAGGPIGDGAPSWNTATGYWVTCAFTCFRHGPLDAGPWLAALSPVPRAAFSSRTKPAKANISDAQTATFDFGDLQVVWNHRAWGESVDPEYPWSATLYEETRERLPKASVFQNAGSLPWDEERNRQRRRASLRV